MVPAKKIELRNFEYVTLNNWMLLERKINNEKILNQKINNSI